MADIIYRVDLWRFGEFKIKECEVIKRTAKTVTIKPNDCAGGRYNLKSKDYCFFDTKAEAELAAENLITNRLRSYATCTEMLQDRLREVCRHKTITMSTGKCARCGFVVPNPDDYVKCKP